MYIAVAADGKKLENQVSQRFASCKYLLIVNMSDLTVNAIENEGDSSGENLAKKVIDFDCEAIITGELTLPVFDILAGACITRYFGFGYSAEKALALMEKYALPLIKNHEGTDNCGGEHHGNSENGHHHDCEADHA